MTSTGNSRVFDFVNDSDKSFDFEAMKEEAIGRYKELEIENPEETWDDLMRYFNPALLVMGTIGAKYIKLPNPHKMKSYASNLSNKILTQAKKSAPLLKEIKDKFVQTWRNKFIDNNVRRVIKVTSEGSVKVAKPVRIDQVSEQIKNLSHKKIMENSEIRQYVRSYEGEMLKHQGWRWQNDYSKITNEMTKITGGRSQKELLKVHGDNLIKKGDWIKDFVKVNPQTGRITGSDWKRTMMDFKESIKVYKKNTEEFKELIKRTYPNIKVK